jgi:hypothetical protein
MKTTNKLKPALEANPDAPTGYQVRVEFSNGRWAELNFSEKLWAQMEFNRIRASGIYLDSWVVNTTLEQL